jgi:hypothetical protein
MRAPDVKTVAISRVDGGVTVMRVIENEYDPAGELRVHFDITPEYVESLIAKHNWQGPLAPVSWEFVPNDYTDDNMDYTYRNAWKHVPGQVKPDHDMEKARLIQRIYLRKARIAEFCRLDTDYVIADEAGNEAEKKRIGALRQKFRDVPAHPRIAEAKTVEELKKLKLSQLVPETKGVKYMDKMRFSTAKIAEGK